MICLFWAISFITGLEPLLELAAVLGAGDDRRHVEGEHPVVRSTSGQRPVGDEQREPLDDRRLAHAGLADQDRIVLLPPGQDLHDPLDFLGPPDGRIELPLRGELGEIAAEVVEAPGSWTSSRSWARRSAGCRRRRRGLGHVAAQQAERLRPGLFQVDTGVGQHLRRDPFSSRSRPSRRCSVPT
jgi:hypothetical protein